MDSGYQFFFPQCPLICLDFKKGAKKSKKVTNKVDVVELNRVIYNNNCY